MRMSRQNYDINLSGVRSRPIKDDKGRVLNNEELITEALDRISDYEKTNETPCPIAPEFVQWLKDAKQEVDAGGNVVDYINKTVLRQTPIDLVVANTNKLNKR